MKIAMIAQPWDPVRPPVTSGSVAIWIYEVCRRLARREDCEITVFAQHAPGDPETEHHEGVEYRRLPLGRTGRSAKLKHRLFGRASRQRPFFASRYFCSDFINAVAREIRARKFDIVHIQNYAQFVPVVRRANPNAGIILHMRCEWLLQLDRAMLVRHIGQADLVINVSKYLTNASIARFPEVVTRFMTLANGVDVTYFGSLAEGIDVQRYRPEPERIGNTGETAVLPDQAEHLRDGENRVRAALAESARLDGPVPPRNTGETPVPPPAPPLLLFVSRVSPEKGVHILLKTFERVHQVHPDCRLRIIGPPGALEPELMLDISNDPMIQGCAAYFRGDYLAMLKAEMAPAIADAVEFLGHVPHDQLPAHYRSATLLLAPSLSEAFGRSPIEAMACGVPVVGATTGGIAESVVHEQTGLLVPPNDSEALAEAILALLADPQRRVEMGVNAWRRTIEKYSWESIAERTRDYYEELLMARSVR